MVKVGDLDNSYGYGYLVSKRLIVVPAHYTEISTVYVAKQKLKAEFISEIAIKGQLDGLKILRVDQDLPFSNIKLNIPQSEFPGLIISPAFSQCSSVYYDPEKGLLCYTADSNMGDCGQPVINSETNEIVGFHIGVNKTNRQARVAYALALSPKLLSQLNTLCEEQGF